MKKMLVCNHKMYLTHDEALNLKLKMDDLDFKNIDLIVCPSFLNVDIFRKYNLGVQNCFYENKGAYTGEVSPYDLATQKIRYVILGHCERRKYETNDMINKKVKACIKNAITPIICIGETRLEKEMMKTSSVLKKQILSALQDIDINNEEFIFAYEPVYKVGAKDTMTLSEINDVFIYIRKVLEEKGIDNYKLLYGGSINGKNISNILADNIDGYLIGYASTDIDELKNVIKCINDVK